MKSFSITVYGFQNNLATPSTTLLTTNTVNTHSGMALSCHMQMLLIHQIDNGTNALSLCILQDTVCRKTFLRVLVALVLLVQEFLLLQVLITLNDGYSYTRPYILIET